MSGILNGKWPRSLWIAWDRDNALAIGSGGVRYSRELVRWKNATIIKVSSMTISSVENVRARVDYVNEDGSSYLVKVERDRYDYSRIKLPKNTKLLEFEVSSTDGALLKLNTASESSNLSYAIRFERSQVIILGGNNVSKSEVT